MTAPGTSMRRMRQDGFSLVELMVAIILALFLTGGLLAMFLAGKQTWRAGESMSRIQENARFAVHHLSRYVRMADYRVDPINTPPLNNAVYGCTLGDTGCPITTVTPVEDNIIEVRYEDPGGTDCAGNTVTTTATATFSIKPSADGGTTALFCNGQELINGVTAVDLDYQVLLADGNMRLVDAAAVTAAGQWNQVVAVHVDLTVDRPEGGPVNPGAGIVAGGDDLSRTFGTTIHLRNRIIGN